MLTRNKKKRTARKNKRCPENSNKKYSTIPQDNALEVGEIVMVDHGGPSGGLDDDYQRTNYLEVAWLLREKLNNLVDSDMEEFQELGLRSLLDMAVSRNIISTDPKMLNPILWRTLPKELLLLVLARLPVSDITCLRSLSRGWRRDMATVNSEINRACEEASSTMVALLSHSSTGAFFVTICDITRCNWQYVYHLHLRRPWNDDSKQWPYTWIAVDGCDGGLMCFISLWKPTKHNRLCIVMVNLLTRVQHELPPLHYQYYTLPTMVQIKVDLDTKCYKVVVATYRAGGLTIEIYDSSTRQWTRATPPCGSIFGLVHTWTSTDAGYYKLSSSTPGAYDFGERTLELYSDINPSTKESMSHLLVIDKALVKDRMFELQEEWTQMDTSLKRRMHKSLHITEYHLDNWTKDWVKAKSYECPSFRDCIVEGLYSVCLNACDGFLMVSFHYKQGIECFRLFNLSTSEWSNILENENSKGLHTPKSMLCRAFWNVIP